LLEDALIKVSSVASSMRTVSARDMVQALIDGERDGLVLAELARGAMRGKRAALAQALTGRFDEHHAELARMLLDQIATLTAQPHHPTTRIEPLPPPPAPPAGDRPAHHRPATGPPPAHHPTPPPPDTPAGTARRGVIDRLADIPGIN